MSRRITIRSIEKGYVVLVVERLDCATATCDLNASALACSSYLASVHTQGERIDLNWMLDFCVKAFMVGKGNGAWPTLLCTVSQGSSYLTYWERCYISWKTNYYHPQRTDIPFPIYQRYHLLPRSRITLASAKHKSPVLESDLIPDTEATPLEFGFRTPIGINRPYCTI